MKSFFTVSLLFTAILLMSFVLSTDGPRYKNLKVLPRDTNKQQMDSVMKHFSQSLGVRCNFCHVFNQEQKAMDFASDNNEHKKIARDMMKMTYKLNEKYFDIRKASRYGTKLEVTCYSCHHGSAHVSRQAQAGEGRAQEGRGERRPPEGQRMVTDTAAKHDH